MKTESSLSGPAGRDIHPFIAPLAVRRAAVTRARARLPEIVYRTMRLEGENITRDEAEKAVLAVA